MTHTRNWRDTYRALPVPPSARLRACLRWLRNSCSSWGIAWRGW
jgi:hypothetical protein